MPAAKGALGKKSNDRRRFVRFIRFFMNKTVSLFSANLLYLITMLLVLVAGSAVQTWNLSLGLLATEIFLILLPALLLLRVRGIPWKEGLRLQPIRAATAAVALLLGVCAWLFSIYIEGIMMQITGMLPVSLPEGSLPTNAMESILYFAALAISAPVCEEALFRGALQQPYERQRGPRFAIVLVGLMFAFYHFRVSGLPALLPVSFLLGWAAWRTGSLYASILIHFGMNASSAANTLIALNGGGGIPLTNPWLALIGLGLLPVLILALRRLQPAPVQTEAPAREHTSAPRRTWLQVYWPLVGASLVYSAVAGLTLAASLFPELTAVQGARFNPAEDVRRAESVYQITNRAGEVVGEAICVREPDGELLRLHCTRTVTAYQAKVGNSFFQEGDSTSQWTAAWDTNTLALKEYTYQMQAEGAPAITAQLEAGTLVSGEENQPIALPQGVLVEKEWPWRAAFMDKSATAYQLPYAHLMRWDESQKKSLPGLQEALMHIAPLEHIETPAGSFETHRIRLDQEQAWYADTQPLPVQYDDGMVIYSLVR
jgi:membrane protease YdiL (CAAX protease family)